MKKNIIIIGNDKGLCRKLKYKICEMGFVVEIKLSTVSHLNGAALSVVDKLKMTEIVLAYKNEELKAATKIFYDQGIFRLFVCPWDTNFFPNKKFNIEDCIISVDNSKPRLDYLEIEVSESCNLNCKGCNEFSNLVKDNTLGDLDSVTRDLKRLKSFFWGIGKIRLMGGEPLVNPDYVKFVKVSRLLFPDSDIRILTNGLLIPTLKKADLEEVKASNCAFDISDYPPTHKILSKIDARLKEVGISYNLSVPNKVFFKSLLKEPSDSPDEAFNNCLFTHCHALSGGYISACSNQMYAYRLNTAFDLHFPEDDKIDIYDTKLTGWEINEIFSKSHNFCRFCGRGMVPYKWTTCPGSKAKASDWLIEPNFINLRVMPVVQRAAKPFAGKLRYIRQRPKKNRND